MKRPLPALDCALLQRSVRQVYLTNAGQQLLQTTQRSFAELTDTLRQIILGDKARCRKCLSLGKC
ncbi:MAG: LysR family transcriptional regulator [Gammaproteobacteria bacterium]|nr:LysR family transcriptional regulator [Gammaproteobacteria bacterium]